MRRLPCLISVLAIGLALSPAVRAGDQPPVQVSDGQLELPTYLLGPEDPNPPFPLVTRNNVYPYPMLDDLSDRVEKRSYHAVYLENEYLKVTVLPSLGARVYSVYDKVSRREVFYRNNVVKYGLVALRGAWISGGIEFNFPDGHTTDTVSPVMWSSQRKPDGSATVTVGDVDRVTGMHWEVALSLAPGEARLRQKVTLFNPTPVEHRYWFWANAAVPATDDMRFVYPMREAYPHATWPVYTFPDYKGTDYSWYKNARHPTSLFARQSQREFFGAYYQDADYGVVHVADYRDDPGKKIWTWGTAGDGLIWTGLLTDHDGPYNEIQSGRFETQLEHEFMPPHQFESWSEYWYPVRGLKDGFVAATGSLALNVRFAADSGQSKQAVEISLCSAVPLDSLTLQATLGSEVLRQIPKVTLNPLAPAVYEVPVSDLQAAKKALVVKVLSGDRVLASWSAAEPVDGNPDFVPASGVPRPAPPDPAKMTVEQLFLSGLGEEKRGDDATAQRIYRQVLDHDAGFVPALERQAWWHYEAADLAGAEALIALALKRDSTNPAINYTAGVIYSASGRVSLAEDAFWAAIRYGGAPSPAFAELGQLAARQKRYPEAARLLRRAVDYNPDDAVAMIALAAALRLGGNGDAAGEISNQALERLPIFPLAQAERWLDLPNQPYAAFSKQDALDVAAWYRRLGDYPAADAVLEDAMKQSAADSFPPMFGYYLASNARHEHQVLAQAQGTASVDPAAADEEKRARQYLERAQSASPDLVFPQRLDDALVLSETLAADPLDAHAQYYLGNFDFAHGRYDDAASLWIRALGGGFDSAVLERNLGVHAWRVKGDLKSAALYYEKAIQIAPADHRLYADLDRVYASQGDNAKRDELFARAPAAVLDHDPVRLRLALLRMEEKQPEKTLALLAGHHFKPWEGGDDAHRVYAAAAIQLGRDELAAHHAAQAEAAFRRALEYPENLGAGKPENPADEAALYWLGEALSAEGKSQAAHEAWAQAVAEMQALGREQADVLEPSGGGVPRVFGAMALLRLGRNVEANKVLDALGASKPGPETSYVAGLAERARHHDDLARRSFHRSLEADPSFWPARLELNM